MEPGRGSGAGEGARPTKTLLWIVWLPIGLALTVPPFLNELDPRTGHPPGKALGLGALSVGMLLWIWLRRKWPRAEWLILAAAAILPAVIREPRATLAAAAITASALAFGRRACDWLRLPVQGRVEQIVVSAALGFGSWILVLMALGLAHGLYTAAIIVLIVGGIVSCRRGLSQLAATAGSMIDGWNEPAAMVGMQTFALLVTIAMAHLVMLAPCLYFDAYTTHLAMADYAALHHLLEPMPLLRYSALPQGFELLMAGAGMLAGQAAQRMISPVFLLLTVAALYAIARELRLSRAASIVGAVFAVAIPCIQWTGASVKNDLPLAFLVLAALLAFLRCLATRSASCFYAGAFFCAAALNVKLSALVTIAILAVLYFLAALRLEGRVRAIAVACAIVLLFGGYWPLRNKIIFGSFGYPLDTGVIARGMGEAGELPAMARVVKLAALPWTLQFHGGFAFDRQNETPLGFLFLLFIPAWFWIRWRDWTAAVWGCVFLVVTYMAFWGLTFPVLRYAAAPIGLIVLALGAGMWNALRAAPAWLRICLLAAAAYCHVYNWSAMASLGVRIQRLQLLAGRMDTDTFLRRMLATYPSANWIRDHARPGEAILSIGNTARAYMGDPGPVNVLMHEEGPFPVSKIRDELQARPYRYLVLSRQVDAGQVFAGRAAPLLESADEEYFVFRLR